MKRFYLISLIGMFFIFDAYSQNEAFIEKNYVKSEYQVKMRDGVKLFTIVYSPIDNSDTYPILMQRTPYSIGPYGDRMRRRMSTNNLLEEDKYIFVFQDVRGKFMSEGEFVDMRPVKTLYENKKDTDETTDTWDTVDWLIKNIENNNGKVGMYGTSYPGFYAVMGSINAHPAMVCTSPQAPISDWFLWDDMHHNGAFTFAMSFNFFQVFGKDRPEPTQSWGRGMDYPTPDAYNFFLDIGPVKNVNEKYLKGEIDFWNKFMEHPNYDEFWQAKSTIPHLKDIKPAVLTVGGWYDGEDLSGALQTYKTIEKNDPDATNMLVMGPWVHGGWGNPEYNNYSKIPFYEEDKQFYEDQIEYNFFRHYLKGKGKMDFPDAWMFETGSAQWKSYDVWPPSNLEKKKVYLQPNKKLSFDPPTKKASAFDEFVSDPDNPVPYTSTFISCRSFYNSQYLSEDQRFASSRPDVLEYDGEVLEEDFTIAGPIEVELYVSTNGSDADWVRRSTRRV
jgi:putative CocE/NonD family hydrolase